MSETTTMTPTPLVGSPGCTCAGEAPTVPVYRGVRTHLPTCALYGAAPTPPAEQPADKAEVDAIVEGWLTALCAGRNLLHDAGDSTSADALEQLALMLAITPLSDRLASTPPPGIPSEVQRDGVRDSVTADAGTTPLQTAPTTPERRPNKGGEE